MSFEQEVYDFRKKFELEYNLYQDLVKEKFRVEMRKVSMQNKVRNLTKAEYSEVSRAIPFSRKLVFAMFLATVLSAALGYLLDSLFPVVKGRTDLMDMGLQYIGGIQDFGKTLKTRSLSLYHKINGNPVRVFRFDVDSLALAGLFKIRSKILHQMEEMKKDHAIIAFVGASVGDGKTFSATNAAAAMASLGRKTLLVDTDLRAHGASRLFNLQKQAGLVDVLEQPELFGKIVAKNVLPHLDVLPAGKKVANPTEFFARSSFKELMDKFSCIYDFVILDTPPILLIPETVDIEKAADFLVFVTSYNKTKVDDLVRACDSLLEFSHGSKKHLVIINRLDPRHDNLVMSPTAQYYYGNEAEKAN